MQVAIFVSNRLASQLLSQGADINAEEVEIRKDESEIHELREAKTEMAWLLPVGRRSGRIAIVTHSNFPMNFSAK